jgi:hypothetical protein
MPWVDTTRAPDFAVVSDASASGLASASPFGEPVPSFAASQVAAAALAVVSKREISAQSSNAAPIVQNSDGDSESDAAAAPRRLAPPVEEETAKHSSAPESAESASHDKVQVEVPASASPAVATIDVSSSVLPPGWSEAVSEDGEIYFFHEDTGATTWDRPGSDLLSDAAAISAAAEPHGTNYYIWNLFIHSLKSANREFHPFASLLLNFYCDIQALL